MQKTRPGISEEIPTSSMADIAFLLIIYFMVTTTFTATRGLDFGIPTDEDESEIDPIASILIEVDADGGLTVDSRALPLEELLAYLRPRIAPNPAKPVIVKTDPEAPYGAMVRVLDKLRQAPAELGLDEEIQVSIPTQREMASVWI